VSEITRVSVDLAVNEGSQGDVIVWLACSVMRSDCVPRAYGKRFLFRRRRILSVPGNIQGKKFAPAAKGLTAGARLNSH